MKASGNEGSFVVAMFLGPRRKITIILSSLTYCPLRNYFPCGVPILTALSGDVVFGYDCWLWLLVASEGWGHGEDHGAPEAGNSPGPGPEIIEKTKSCQRVSGTKSP